MEDNTKFIKNWGVLRKKGKLKYIIIDTVKEFIITSLGVTLIALVGAIYITIRIRRDGFDVIFNAYVLKRTLLNISALQIGHIIYSNKKWKDNENKYNELSN